MPIIHITARTDNSKDLFELFDTLQVWKSITGPTGTYFEITAPNDDSAKLTGTVAGPWSVLGQTLTLTVNNGDPFSHVFTGADPLDLASLLDQLDSISPLIAAANASGFPKLLTTTTKTGAALQVSGAAATTLGLPLTKANGKTARPLLSPTTDLYRFADLDGSSGAYYKTRFYNSETGQADDFSAPIQGFPATVVSGSSLVLASVSLADGTGAPVVGRRVILVPIAPPFLVEGFSLLPTQDRIILTTDDLGHAEQKLVKGARFRVFFEGSGFQREFVVPDADFDLMTVIATSPDPFTIAQPPPLPIRSS